MPQHTYHGVVHGKERERLFVRTSVEDENGRKCAFDDDGHCVKVNPNRTTRIVIEPVQDISISQPRAHAVRVNTLLVDGTSVPLPTGLVAFSLGRRIELPTMNAATTIGLDTGAATFDGIKRVQIEFQWLTKAKVEGSVMWRSAANSEGALFDASHMFPVAKPRTVWRNFDHVFTSTVSFVVRGVQAPPVDHEALTHASLDGVVPCM